MGTFFEDLYDIEKRPGAGLELWANTVERQLERVRDANYRHRLHHSKNPDEQRDDPGAEEQLHAEVYFLALAVRRVLLFVELLARQVDDPRLVQARAAFASQGADSKRLRDFLEHIGEYLLDDYDRKHMKFAGRAAPVLRLRWDSDNVVVSFGPYALDVTVAAVSAVEIGRAGAAVWEEHLDRVKALSAHDLPPADDGIVRMLDVTMGRSTVIGGPDNPPEIITGGLIDVRVREATPQEIADLGADTDGSS